MKNKFKYIFNFLWSGLIAFSLPVCIAIIYADITGHSKGFGYDLGPEKDISIMIGCIELIIWLVLALPSNIFVFRKTREKGSRYLIITYAVFIFLAVLCIYLIGGWSEYTKCFH